MGIEKKNLNGLTINLYDESDGCNCSNIIKNAGMERIDYMLNFLDISIKKINRNDKRILVDFKNIENCKRKTATMIQARILELIDFLSITDKEWKSFVLKSAKDGMEKEE